MSEEELFIGGQPSLLIVEDEALISVGITTKVEDWGCIVLDVVDSGEKAIKVARENNPDLILMDIVIKGALDGIQTAEEIRQHQSIPVIFLTSYDDPKTLRRAWKINPVDYLLKPFRDVELRGAIYRALHNMDDEQQKSGEAIL